MKPLRNLFKRGGRRAQPPAKPQTQGRLESVIEIGSTGIRLLIAEIRSDDWSVIDRSEQPIPIGRDVFSDGIISRETLLQTLHILNRFAEQLKSWGLKPENARVIATSAFREARNRDAVIDRIQVKTNFSVSIIDGIEEMRLMYLAVYDCLKRADNWPAAENSLIIEVGGGSTEIMLIEQGKMTAAHSLRFGTVIIEQKVKEGIYPKHNMHALLEEFTRSAGGELDVEMNLYSASLLVAVGGESLLAAEHCGKELHTNLTQITRDDFIAFLDEIKLYSPEECAHRFHIPYYTAQSVYTNLLVHKIFMDLSGAQRILVPHVSLREGLIISLKQTPDKALKEEFDSQIISSAYAVAKKYHADKKHAAQVCRIALTLFDKLDQELGLDMRLRQILEVAAILHDVGRFIGSQDHHLHSRYIIANSEIFGISKKDISVISQVACYHRGMLLPHEESDFVSDSGSSRVIVMKLASILRIAEALDHSHSQKIKDFSLELKENTLTIRPATNIDITIEKLAMQEKAAMFESVFGYKVILAAGRESLWQKI